MNSEIQEKLAWQTPEVIDLDVKCTESGDVHPTEISTSAGPLGS